MNILKKLRVKEGHTLNDVSRLTGLNRATISRIENNQSELNETYIKIFTELYNCSSDYLLGLIDYNEKSFFESMIPLIDSFMINTNLSGVNFIPKDFKKTDLPFSNEFVWLRNSELTILFEELIGFVCIDDVSVLINMSDNISKLEDTQLIIAVIPSKSLYESEEIYDIYRVNKILNNEDQETLILTNIQSSAMYQVNISENKSKWLFIGSIYKIDMNT